MARVTACDPFVERKTLVINDLLKPVYKNTDILTMTVH